MKEERKTSLADPRAVLEHGGEMGALMRTIDWAKTPVGPVEGWPQSLRTVLSVLLSSDHPFFVWWGEELVQFYNDGYRPILGSTKHPSAMGQRGRECWSEIWDVIEPMIAKVFAGGSTYTRDGLLVLDRHGFLEECYFNYAYSPVRDESGAVAGVFVACSESTGRVLGERRLKALGELANAAVAKTRADACGAAARVLATAAPDVPFALLYLLDEGGETARLAGMTGLPPGHPVARPTLTRGHDAEGVWPFARALQAPVDVDVATFALPGGPWPECSRHAVILPLSRTSADVPHGFLVAGVSPRLVLDDAYRGFLRLIAGHVATAVQNARAYEEERGRAEALLELDRAKTLFFSNVSHEFRTPLTLMLGPLEDVLEERAPALPNEHRERVELVHRNALRLQKLVNTLLDFARIEAGRSQASFVPIDLAALTTELASSFNSAMENAGLALVIESPRLPEAVYVDPSMWEKIVLNLLSNAFKFTFEGVIRLALEWRGDHVELSVYDTGTGIPESELPRIFDRFHRVEGARGRSYEGTGIGLALVRDLVKLHGGEITVKSEVGKGSTFTVAIPTGSAHLPKDRGTGKLRTLASTGIGPDSFLAEVSQWNDAAFASEEKVGVGAHLLVVDDNADMRRYISRLLSPYWSVQTVSDGAEALAVAKARPPALILSDVMMPGADGLNLVRALRANERTRTVPVILLSARAGEEATIEGLKSGADEYLVKPFSANELRARVRARLALSQVRDEAMRAERAHTEEARRLLGEAEHATRSRQEMLAIVSHDLRSPLGAISTAAELLDASLENDERGAKMRKRTDIIRRSVERMSRLLADLLDVASIEAGRLSLESDLHSAADLVRENHEAFESQAVEKGVAFETEVAPDLPPLPCDRERILQALGNLVSNAIKFTPAGGVVRVRAELDGKEAIRFTVADDGPGIPPEARPHVFDRYWHAAQKNRQGHGLGLAITKGIVDSHAGSLRLASGKGPGTTFCISLPLTRIAPPIPLPLDVRPSCPAGAGNFVLGGGECGALVREFDWSTTALGPMAEWPQSLRTSVSTMLRSPYPITLFWGRELVMLYNDPFRPIHGDKHPGTMGASARTALAEAWHVLGPLVEKTLATGEPIFVENGLVIFSRRPGGLKEEAYFTWSYNPTIDEAGEIAGLFAIASETTRQVVGDRRLGTLRELSLRTAVDRNVAGLYQSVESVLATAVADVPFALLYIVAGSEARLVSCTGVERGSVAAPNAPALDATCPWPLATVASTGEEALLEELPPHLGALPGGPWAEPATRALVLRVPMGADTQTTGVLVCGLSPLLSLDVEYRSFLQLLARQVSTSISSTRAYEHETQRAEKLAALDRAKTDFFSNVSHEFRTPLTLILGPVEDALAQHGGTLSGERLEMVRRSALRLHKMVNALLDFSRVEAGRAQATFVPTDLAAFTVSLASHFQSAAARVGLELVVDCPPLPEAIYVDPDMWEKILLNLLSNAVKYTHRGRISVHLSWEAEGAVVVVADTGIGITEDELPRVFDRFYRVREAQGRSHEGTGIGLALARELVELHGGTIEVASKLGAGTRFTVRMPRGSAHLPSQRLARTSGVRSSAAGAAAFVEEAKRWSPEPAGEIVPSAIGDDEGSISVPPSLVSSRILLVDDNADLRAYAAGLLARVFPNVETATNGREALDRALEQPPHLIVSDVMMPVMDGFELVRALRGDERTRSIPVILLSARAGDEPTVEGLGSGADDYLVKPFSARELLARVRSQLEMSRVRAEVWRERGQVEELRRSIAARDAFISISSHELRTPLTALQIQIESLLRNAEPGRSNASDSRRIAHKLTVALRQVDRLTRLVESLLDASRATLGSLELDPEAFDLAELARSVVQRFEGEARAKNASFHVSATPAPGVWDKTRIDQVLSGLLSNAIKYAPGTVIEVTIASDSHNARAIVRDVGMGIPAEALGRVFERFERSVSVDSYGGFGIGLFLSRKIVEAHGGTIEVVSTPGVGTTMTVTLPHGEVR